MSVKNSEYEKCVMCGSKTNVLVETPITSREHYINGCGQLCEKCAIGLEISNLSDNSCTNEQMELLLDLIRNSKK